MVSVDTQAFVQVHLLSCLMPRLLRFCLKERRAAGTSMVSCIQAASRPKCTGA